MTGEITRLLRQAHEGREGAFDEVIDIVYTKLHSLAEKHMRRRYGAGMGAVTLEPAALVNEAFLKLIKQRKRYDNSGHFFAIATRVMLRVLVDHDRKRRAEKRGGDQIRVSLSGVAKTVGAESAAGVTAFAEALERLEKLDPRTAEVVKLKLIWGLAVSEIAQTLGLSVSTIEREWRFARRWLTTELRGRISTAEPGSGRGQGGRK